jgi:NADPH:quinone reductase-like Zn-dependent oxidoreductase
MPKAYVFTEYGGPDTEALVDQPKPLPGPGQLLVAVHAAAVNPADWKFREGWLRETVPLELPSVFGLDCSGVIEDLGDGVDGFAVGDEVFGRTLGTGCYAEYALVPAVTAAHKPPKISFVDAASVITAAGTAYDGIEQLDLQPGAVLLITGVGGGLGVVAAQLARRRGVVVIGTASAAKKAFVEGLGVVHVPYGDGVADRIIAASPGGVDALFDMVGGEAVGAVASLVADPSKRITGAYGEIAGDAPVSRVIRSSDIAGLLAKLALLVESGELTPLVTEVFPLDQAGNALRIVEGGHATGKIAIQVR